jgi:hypothetical protein
MSDKISLRKSEVKVFQSAFQDGLWDIFIGCYLLQFIFAIYLSPYLGDFWSSAVFLPIVGLLFLGLWLIKKYIVKPRLGSVQYGSWRKTRMFRFNLLMLVFLVLALVFGFLSLVEFSSIPDWMVAARFSLVVLIFFSLIAYFLNYTRMYGYGILVSLAPITGEWLHVNLGASHHGWPITFGICAGIMITTGTILFVKFLRSHPLPPDIASLNLAAE